jgi:hypothetical protein
MTTPDDRNVPHGEPEPPAWDAPPQAPAWDRPADGGSPAWGPPPAYAPPAQAGWQGQPGYGPPAQTEGKAVAALVLAIVSWVALPFVAAVVSLVLAGSAKREIDRSQGRLGGSGLVTASRIISWTNIVLCLLVAGVFVLFVVVFAFAGFS